MPAISSRDSDSQMNSSKKIPASLPPTLCSISQCVSELQFQTRSHWPQSLPAVAVNNVVLAGFDQAMVFNHTIDWKDHEGIATLFRSLYSDLSFAELALLWEKSEAFDWFPFSAIAAKFHFQATEHFFHIAKALLQTPMGFQNWCADKKVGPQDLSTLLAAGTLDLKPLFLKILNLGLSKSQGVQALETAIELLLMGLSPTDLQLEISDANSQAEAWLELLKQKRFPEAFARDLAAHDQMKNLPWPGSSQARWARYGDKSGIEIKIFVSNPSDLKKHMQSLSRVQDLMDQATPPGTKPESQH